MAETTADVRRDIELTRERMSDTLAQLESKLNVMQIVKDNPWPALAVAFGAGILLAGSRADVKAAAATVKATGGASSKLGAVLDDVAASVITGVTAALHTRVDTMVGDLKRAIGAPDAGARGNGGNGGNGANAARRDDASLGAGTDAIARGEADRQLLGVGGDGARSASGDQVLGIDLPAQDSGAIGNRRAD